MKICFKCNNQLDDSAMFCNSCGAKLTGPQVPPPTYTAQQQYPGYAANQQSAYQQPVAKIPAQKKGMKWWQILLIVVGALIAVILIFVIAGSVNDSGNKPNHTASYAEPSSKYDNGSEETSSTQKEIKIPYDKGSIQSDKYINEWANLQFDIPEGWVEADKTQDPYDSASDVDTGLFVGDIVTNENISIGFEKLSGFNTAISEERYIEVSRDGMDESYASMGVTPVYSDVYDKTIAGETYKALSITIDSIDLMQELLVHKKDNYMIVVVVSVADSSSVDDVLSGFKPVG